MNIRIWCMLLGLILFHGVVGQTAKDTTTSAPKANVKIYPNPTPQGEKINIDMSGLEQEKVLVTLYNVYGKMVFSRVIIKDSGQIITAIDPSNRVPPGIYLVKGSSENALFERKLIIQK